LNIIAASRRTSDDFLVEAKEKDLLPFDEHTGAFLTCVDPDCRAGSALRSC
jgi:hypothetical protein